MSNLVFVKPNLRIALLGMIFPLLFTIIAGALLFFATTWLNDYWLIKIVCWGVFICGSITFATLIYQCFLPRVGYQQGHLLLYLQFGPPFRVPIEIVECFLMGFGPSFLPGKEASEAESINLIVRLREKEEDFAKRELPVWLGNWCGSQIVIRGAWCEPLDEDFVRALNTKLDEVQTEHSRTKVTQ